MTKITLDLSKPNQAAVLLIALENHAYGLRKNPERQAVCYDLIDQLRKQGVN